MTPMVRARLLNPRVLSVALIAALALIPAFTAAPGLLPSDSKLGLYLDPGALISAARWAYDPQLFAGWVPHQQIGFVWPTGPWFWLGDQLGLSTWVVHRLWIAALLIAAGTGVLWCARRLGLSWTAAVCAGVMYELSPYLLAYVSRTSVMLLPWAGLGWIVGLTVVASQTKRWREPALLSLVVVTVGGVNATALLMIAPAPVLWLVHAACAGLISWRGAVAVAARTALLSTAVSAWWIAMLAIQRSAGANVLEFSETLSDVSTSSTAPEVLRGLGYWLFYIRDAFTATTEASLPHLGRTSIIVLNFAVVVAGFAALASLRWIHRRFAALLIGVGVILAVGVHPIDDPSPLMALLAGPDSESAVAVALRSSTRAVPMVILGLALAVGARITVISTRARNLRASVALVGVFTALMVLNLPAWWTGGFVDPNLARDEPPAAWVEAAQDLNERPGDYRVLQLPGTEFGSFRWGHTNDQPLTWMVDRPLITRDLLPLGSPGAMDLVFALDDRVQDHTLESAALPAIARLLGVDSIWITNDVAHERYRSAPAEPLSDHLSAATGISRYWSSTTSIINRADPPRIDERSIADPRIGAPTPPVEILMVDDPLEIVRIGGETVGFVGSGDGLIDAAAAGLIDGSETIITAPELLADAISLDRVIVTDSNRARPRHWRGSQETVGATESADPRLAPTRNRPGDARLAPPPGAQVTAEQIGAVQATATDYGPAFSYQPEYRPAMALDANPNTAWMVASSPIGQRLRVLVDGGLGSLAEDPVDHFTIRQVHDSSHLITGVAISTDTGERISVDMGEESLSTSGQQIEVPETFADASVIEFELLDIAERDPASMTVSARTDAVGFSTIDVGAAPALEVVTIDPAAWVDGIGAPQDTPQHTALESTMVLTRLRSDPLDRARADPEVQLIRSFPSAQPGPHTISVEVGLDPRAPDEELIRLTGGLAVSSQRLRGSLLTTASAAFDMNPSTAWVSPFSPTGELWLEFELDTAIDTIALTQPEGEFSTITEVRISDADGTAISHPLDTENITTTLELAESIGPGPVRLEITGITPEMTPDYRTGRDVALPVALSVVDTGTRVLEIPPQTPSACREDLLSLNGEPIPITIDRVEVAEYGLGAIIAATPCVDTVQLDTEQNLLIGHAPGALRIDRVVVSGTGGAQEAVAHGDPVGAGMVSSIDLGRAGGVIEVADCVEGCWLIHGHGHNDAWRASVGDVDLGGPISVNGGLNGWYLDRELTDEGAATVTLHFSPQRWLDAAWLLTALGVLASLTIIARSRIRLPDTVAMWRPMRPIPSQTPTHTTSTIAAIAVLSAVLIGPWWGLIGLAAGMMVHLRDRALEWFATFLIGAVAVWIAVANRAQQPLPNLAWPTEFSVVHPLALFAVVVLVGATLFASDMSPTAPERSGADHDS